MTRMREIIIKRVETKEELEDFILFPNELYADCPYYVPDLGRFYYIEEKTMSNGRLFIKAKVDVLMSFAEEILNTWVVLERSEKLFNLYLPDNLLPLETPSNVRTIDFPSGFQNDSEFILILAGSEE